MSWLLGIIGAIFGGVVGYWLFWLLLSQGFYAMILPGALIGLGCGTMSRVHSNALGAVCGVAALLFGVFLEWNLVSRFAEDNSLTYFVRNLHNLDWPSLAMIGAGGLFGFWFGRGRPQVNSINQA